MAKVVGIDLGSHTVKLALLEGGFGRFEHKGFRLRSVPQDIEQAPDLERRLAALGALMDELGADGAEPDFDIAVAAFPAEEAGVRVIELPFADAKQVEKTVQFEVEAQVPFELDTMLLSSRILSLGAGSSKVLVGLAERNAVRHLLAGLEQFDLDPRNLLLDGEVLESLATEGVQAILDIGHTRTLVTVCKGGQVIATRALLGGGRDLTLALAKAFGLGWEEAEARKHTVELVHGEETALEAQVEWADDEVTVTRKRREAAGLDPDDDSLPEHTEWERVEEVTNPHGPEVEIVREALAPLLAQIRATLISLEDTNGIEVGEILLVGGTSALVGLREWLQLAFGVPVRRVVAAEQAHELGIPERFALANILGQRAASNKIPKQLDFRREEFSYKGDVTAFRNIAAYGAVGAMAFMLVGAVLFGYRFVQLTRNLETLDDQMRAAIVETYVGVDPERLKDSATAMAIAQEQTTALSTKVDALKAIRSDEPPTLALLRELSDSVPEHGTEEGKARIDVNDLTIGEGSIVFEAETDNFNTASLIENTLRENPRFKDAHKGEERKCKESICFKMTIPLDAQASAEPSAVAPGEEG